MLRSTGFACVLFALLSSCSYRLTTQGFDSYVPAGDAVVRWQGAPKPELQVLYLGAGHMIIKSGQEAFMTDPFFSIQPKGRLLGKMCSEQRYYHHWLERVRNTVGFGQVHAGLVAHSHYDHLMDLPLLLDEQAFPNMKAVYGNPCMPQMLTHFAAKGVALEGLTEDQVFTTGDPADTDYKWITVTDQLRFLPITTNHAPQFWKFLFMNGKFKPGYFEEHLTTPYSKVANKRWAVGDSYAFLVDIGPKDNAVRIYIQTSASGHPNGLPPAAVLQQKAVDLVILCYASTGTEKNYPGFLLDAMKTPAGYPQVMMVHWEDFFEDHRGYTEEPKLVALTKPKKVRKRWDALGLTPGKVVMPRPGAVVTYR